jgi:hypothetical protein
MIQLPNNKLILNWHRIFDLNQLFEFFSKKFKCDVNLNSEIESILKGYKNLNIAIWHSDTFLTNESKDKHDEIIKLLEKHWTVKQTWKIKKIQI